MRSSTKGLSINDVHTGAGQIWMMLPGSWDPEVLIRAKCGQRGVQNVENLIDVIYAWPLNMWTLNIGWSHHQQMPLLFGDVDVSLAPDMTVIEHQCRARQQRSNGHGFRYKKLELRPPSLFCEPTTRRSKREWRCLYQKEGRKGDSMRKGLESTS